MRRYLSQHRRTGNRSEPDSEKSGCCTAKPLPEELDDLIAWHDGSPEQCAVIRAVVLSGERANRGRQRVLRALVQPADGQIYSLSLTHAALEIRSLLEAVGRQLIGTSKRPLSSAWLESLQTAHADFALQILDEDPCDDAAWDLENWRRQHTVELVREHSLLPLSDIAARSSTDLDRLRRRLNAVRDQFLAALDQDILHAAGYPALLAVKRYSYMAHPDPNIRRNRRLAATTFPILIEEIPSRAGPTSLATRLGLAIDSGDKLIEMLSRTLGVKPAAVRILRKLPVTEAGSRWHGKLPSLLGLLSTCPSERYPRTPEQSLAFNAAIQFVKSATGYPLDSTFAGIVLDNMARRNWLPDAHFSGCLLERARCIETLTRDLAIPAMQDPLISPVEQTSGRSQGIGRQASVIRALFRIELLQQSRYWTMRSACEGCSANKPNCVSRMVRKPNGPTTDVPSESVGREARCPSRLHPKTNVAPDMLAYSSSP